MKKIEHCRKCQKAIVWLRTKNDKAIPIDSETVEDGDVLFDNVKHTTHFATCPHADSFRKRKDPLPPKLTDVSAMPFGEHKDRPMEQVPADYLLYIWECGLWQRPERGAARQLVHDYIRERFSAIESDAKDTIVSHRPQ